MLSKSGLVVTHTNHLSEIYVVFADAICGFCYRNRYNLNLETNKYRTFEFTHGMGVAITGWLIMSDKIIDTVARVCPRME